MLPDWPTGVNHFCFKKGLTQVGMPFINRSNNILRIQKDLTTMISHQSQQDFYTFYYWPGTRLLMD